MARSRAARMDEGYLPQGLPGGQVGRRSRGQRGSRPRLEDERRYIDMTPAIFVLATLVMAVRYVSLGLVDQELYILAGIAFALMYGLRPFFSKMQRPRDE